jgi:hypothetical protein
MIKLNIGWRNDTQHTHTNTDNNNKQMTEEFNLAMLSVGEWPWKIIHAPLNIYIAHTFLTDD